MSNDCWLRWAGPSDQICVTFASWMLFFWRQKLHKLINCSYLCNKFEFHFSRDVPNEVYKNFDEAGAGNKWWEVLCFNNIILTEMGIHSLLTFRISGIPTLYVLHYPFNFCLKFSFFSFSNLVGYLQAVDLQKLILAHNNIEKLKEDLRNLPLLTVLNVSHNKLSELPAAIGEWVVWKCWAEFCGLCIICGMFIVWFLLYVFDRLHMLKLLDVSFNSIMKIPDEIGSATALVK